MLVTVFIGADKIFKFQSKYLKIGRLQTRHFNNIILICGL